MNYRKLNTLYINHSNSICGSCGRGADPYELKHDTILEYSGQSEGCHMEFKHLSSDYMGVRIEEAARDMRPDLEWIGLAYEPPK
jgi:hypothetical protein